MVDYREVLERPFSDWKKLSIGAATYVLPVVSMITGLFGSGYSLMCAKRPEGEMPEWTEWGGLFVKGLLSAVISLIYMIPFLILGFAFYLMMPSSAGMNPAMPNILRLGGPLMIAAALLLLIFIYVLPMAILHYVEEFSFSGAFRINSIIEKVTTTEYLKVWLFGLLYSIGLGIIANAITASLNSFLGFMPLKLTLIYIVEAYTSIILGVTLMTAYGQAFQEISS